MPLAGRNALAFGRAGEVGREIDDGYGQQGAHVSVLVLGMPFAMQRLCQLDQMDKTHWPRQHGACRRCLEAALAQRDAPRPYSGAR